MSGLILYLDCEVELRLDMTLMAGVWASKEVEPAANERFCNLKKTENFAVQCNSTMD